jgi:tRNA-dihydrouridine synthase B
MSMTDSPPRFVIGTVPIYGDLVLAPLAGYSDQPYRSICRRFGSAMSYTEFVSAHGVIRGNERTLELLSFIPTERPVVFQVFGHDPEQLTIACLHLQRVGADIIDINMGCPATRIAGKGGGAGLLRDPKVIARIFARLSKRLSVPVTGKIRLGWDRNTRNYIEIAHVLEDNGASMIAVHGRTREETYKTPADWDAIAQVKQTVRIPVLANGDVRCVADTERIQRHTNCDGVMIGRGAIGNPWIFQRRDRQDVPLTERLEVIYEHLLKMADFYGERRGVLAFRKHVIRYTHGLHGASNVRLELMRCVTVDQVREQLERFLLSGENVL